MITPNARAANITLFATTSDFTGWNPSGGATGAAASAVYDADGATINGAGNNPGNSGASINVGGSSTGGSLQITTPSTGYNPIAYSAGEAYNPAYMHAIDPGSLAAYSAESGYGSGTTVAYSGNMYVTYTIPTDAGAGSYFQLGIFIKYDNHNYNPIFPSSVQDLGTVSGLHSYTATIPYTIDAGSLTYGDLEMFVNSNVRADHTVLR